MENYFNQNFSYNSSSWDSRHHLALPVAITNLQVANGNILGSSASDVMSSMNPVTNQQSILSLCPYHCNQLTQQNHSNHMSLSAPAGGAPSNQSYNHLYPAAGAQAAEESASLYDIDPASKAHAMRLLRLLNSEYSLQQLRDDHECCHSDTQDGAAIESRQSYSYSGLGEMCVRRACLDDYPDWYGTMPPNNYYYNYCQHSSYSYYNYPEQQEREDPESPFAETPGTNAPLLPFQPPSIYVNHCGEKGVAISCSAPQQQTHEFLCHDQLTPNRNPYLSYNPSSF